MTQLELNLTTITEQIKKLQSTIKIIENKINDLKEQIKLKEIKQAREANISLSDVVKQSLGAFDFSCENSIKLTQYFFGTICHNCNANSF